MTDVEINLPVEGPRASKPCQDLAVLNLPVFGCSDLCFEPCCSKKHLIKTSRERPKSAPYLRLKNS